MRSNVDRFPYHDCSSACIIRPLSQSCHCLDRHERRRRRVNDDAPNDDVPRACRPPYIRLTRPGSQLGCRRSTTSDRARKHYTAYTSQAQTSAGWWLVGWHRCLPPSLTRLQPHEAPASRQYASSACRAARLSARSSFFATSSKNCRTTGDWAVSSSRNRAGGPAVEHARE